ncbi:MAG TPA: acyl carrier protein [Nitrospirae bacterium]|nr:acyl carrier protein [bacterium BMS3Abin15]HDO25333.1 acyl carrier protein [Nitrospirota bacterium]
MNADFDEELKVLISDIIEVPVEELLLESDFIDDLKVDSLKAIEIVAAVERKYRIVIPEEDIPKVRSLETIRNYIVNAKKD